MLLHGLVVLKKREMDSVAGKKYSVRKTIIFYGRNFISFLVFFLRHQSDFFCMDNQFEESIEGLVESWLSSNDGCETSS